ncbi:MAG TPA: chromosome segregation protein SMC [Gammaproteobacteria bacterium]|nr:chromosome segregation protein SMC [Gammaproteobacteria bacterium]
MRLSKIKLAGFKSFVDPTTITFPTNLTGIVGPNGCGKSNTIDAVRWVMGESSAKHLRGDSMADVIFNGSTARKPVGTASIELVFDNSDGAVGGQYAQYAEISVRREVSRDGASNYFLNGARCRRRDITDIFLGTGLGPRSYAIIEQGTISRLIDAKPEELRVFLEEAAGISKYKERRRETENRIRHTRENISRLDDLRDEIHKQLQHLQRQARTAERYKKLKAEARQVGAELLALKWRGLDRELAGEDHAIVEHDTALQAVLAQLRSVESQLEKTREQQHDAQATFNQVQARYYDVGSAIARAEQALQHARDLRQRHQNDLEETEHAWRTAEAEITRDREQVAELTAVLEELEPALARARAAEADGRTELDAAEAARQDWQTRWDAFNQAQNESSRASQVERTRIDHLERQSGQTLSRIEKLEAERERHSTAAIETEIGELEAKTAEFERTRETLKAEQEQLQAGIAERRERLSTLAREHSEKRSALADKRGRLGSLKTLQQQALGKNEARLVDWLKAQGLDDKARLAEVINVDEGWEQAVETVLGGYLQAVCLDDMEPALEAMPGIENGTLHVIGNAPAGSGEAGADSLAAKVRAPVSLEPLLGKVYAAKDMAAAVARRGTLKADESLITPDGVWVGPNWARVARAGDARAGMLSREREIKTLEGEIAELEQAIAADAQTEESLSGELKSQEARREALQDELNRHHQQEAAARAALNSRRERLREVTARHETLVAELNELKPQQEKLDDETRTARRDLEQALGSLAELEDQRAGLQREREAINERLEAARQRFREDRDHVQTLALKQEARRATLDSTRQNLERMQARLTELGTRREQLQRELEGGTEPIAEQEKMLQENLARRGEVEAELAAARRQVEALDESLRKLEQDRVTLEQDVEAKREVLESRRLATQELRTRRKTIEEQLEAEGQMLIAVLVQLEDDADAAAWAERAESLEQRIQRLGAINLAAIEEYDEQSERAEYLEKQHADLNDALTTLENAIHKIDRETRTRFKETFDLVNAGLKANFPRLFGGGHAYLELTGEELLDAGVTVMARPPGKRNSTIHLLSGGEKALTAVALVFSIFELNPAPFCMLDEVDAPLDDANVGRFCDLVRDMSEHVQFIYITHNKVTMEMASHLTGVTMHEPGVSRLVAVDVEEAARMAATA